jgi:hypothetical protein
MSEEDARKMLVERLKKAYMMDNPYKGHGDSGGKFKYAKRKAAAKDNPWLHCVKEIRNYKYLKDRAVGLKKIGQLYNKDKNSDSCFKNNLTNRQIRQIAQNLPLRRARAPNKGFGRRGRRHCVKKQVGPSGLERCKEWAKGPRPAQLPIIKRGEGILADDFYGNGVLIDSTYGMGMKRKNAGHKRGARHNPWIQEVKRYQQQHGVSYKDAMIALAGSR